MRVQVLLFASHREAAGRSRIEVDMAEGSSPGDVYERLAAECPGLEPLRRYTSFAVNREFAASDVALHDGDELALIQPVSGGAA